MTKRLAGPKVLVGIGLWLSLSMSAVAAAPLFINYQGKLTDNVGNPTVSQVSVNFKFYNVATGGSPLHSVTNVDITPVNGVFSYSVPVPATLFKDYPVVYLAVEVGGAELSPRQQLVSAPYALAVAAGSVLPNDIASGSLPSAVIASSVAVNTVGAAQLQAMTLPTNVIASSVAVGAVGPTQLQRPMTLPTNVIASSVAVNTVGAAQLQAMTLPANVIAISVAVNAVGTLQINDGAVSKAKMKSSDLDEIYTTSDGRLILGNIYHTAMCDVNGGSPRFYGCDGNCDQGNSRQCTSADLVGRLIKN